MISNSTIQHYFTEISDTELELFTPILSPVEATLTGLVSGVIAIYGLLTQLSIFRLLKRRSGRGINRIIYYQQVNIYAHPYLCIYKVFFVTDFHSNVVLLHFVRQRCANFLSSVNGDWQGWMLYI